MSNSSLALVKNQQLSGSLTVQSMDDLARLADMMTKSGFFDDCKSAAQAGVKIMAGIELGIPAFASLVGIHIIKGKPAIGANVMAAMIKRSGRYNYRVLEHTTEICKIAFFEGKEQIGISEFSAADAAKLGVQNMGKFPRNMLFARAISNGVKWHCPDLFLGAPVYTPEELGIEVDEDGKAVDVQVVAPEVVKPSASDTGTDQFLLERLKVVQEYTGMSSSEIGSIASRQKPAIQLDSMTETEFIQVRNSVYAAWGFQQTGAFKARTHAWNAFQEVAKDLPDEAGDRMVWESWQGEVAGRVSAASQPAVAVDEEF